MMRKKRKKIMCICMMNKMIQVKEWDNHNLIKMRNIDIQQIQVQVIKEEVKNMIKMKY